MGITTKTGGGGKTDLIGIRVAKTDVRLELIGTVDELLSALSVANSFVAIKKYKDEIANCQEALFAFNAQIAGAKLSDMEGFTNYFEDFITKNESGAFSFSFVTKKAASFVDFCRTTARRAERIFYKSEINRKDLASFLNRISDYLYVLSRLLESEEE